VCASDLSCELIDNNGKELKKCCNNYAKDWNLEAEFIDWMNNANTLCFVNVIKENNYAAGDSYQPH